MSSRAEPEAVMTTGTIDQERPGNMAQTAALDSFTRAPAPAKPGPLTLAEKIWNSHVVDRQEEAPDLIYIDLHLVHEATSPQAFEGLREAGRTVRRPDLTLAVEDHNVPTDTLVISDPVSRAQLQALRRNCEEYGIELFRLGDQGQGIVHVIAPETGLVQPGMTVVCGDSHTSTHGALGALAFGIGTSEVEHVLATQSLALRPWKSMQVDFAGQLPRDATAKDMMLALISTIGPNGAQGYIVEYTGPAIRQLSVEARMTLCNMTIEAGARAGLVAPDQTTCEYLRGRQHAPAGDAWDEAVAAWSLLATDAGARFDRVVRIDTSRLGPYVTWGTNPGQAAPLHDPVPDPVTFTDPAVRTAAERALDYMAIAPGTRLSDVPVDTVFVGSCTNGRLEDLRVVAGVLRGRRVAAGVRMLIVPGSMRVREQAEQEGLAEIFEAAGAEWRNAGCSMCLAMNPDRLEPGQRSASTSNRSFEGRQGPGSRTHLVSPAVAAATAVAGRFAAPDDL
jgi:3-isopropylmalate/(R)-2-methylmalate dehydratase large subunit